LQVRLESETFAVYVLQLFKTFRNYPEKLTTIIVIRYLMLD